MKCGYSKNELKANKFRRCGHFNSETLVCDMGTCYDEYDLDENKPIPNEKTRKYLLKEYSELPGIVEKIKLMPILED